MLARAQLALRSPDGARRALDFLRAALLFRLPLSLRKKLFAGNRHECPICGTHLSRFVILHRPFFHWCPVCRSLQRHRFSWLLLQRQALQRRSVNDILHFAPEEALAGAFNNLAGMRYVTTDRYAPNVAIRADIIHIPHRDAVFDLIYCSHVLEHIPDDRLAMRELRRVLRDDGIALILTPIWGKPTFEDPSISDPHERERHFGQHDHVRWYGLDICDRLRDAGFTVAIIRASDITSPAEIERFDLVAAEIAFVCTTR